jgi:hypothetical protein
MSSTHEDLSRRNEPSGPSDRSFGVVFAGFFFLVALLPVARHHQPRLWALIPSAIFLAISLLRPSLLRLPNRLWTQLGLLLGRVFNPIVMGVLFYGLVTPIAIIRRWSRNDSLRLGFDPNAPTYWQERKPPGPAPETMAKQF